MIPLNTPRRKPQNIFNLSNFIGGLNNTSSPIEIQDNQSPDLLNVSFSSEGSISKRMGTDIVGNDIGNALTLGLYPAYYGNGLSKLLYHSNYGTFSKLWWIVPTTGTWAEATGTALANADTEFESFTDGTNAQVYIADGTTFTAFNPVTNVVATVADGDAPDTATMVRLFRNKLYLAGMSGSNEKINFSALGNGDSWSATDYFNVPSQNTAEYGTSGDPISALAIHQDRLIIFKKRSIWAWDGNVLHQINSQHGCVGKRAFTVLDNYLYFADSDGIYRLSGNFVEKVSINIQATWDAVPYSHIRQTAMAAFQGRLYVATASSEAAYNDIVLVNYPQLPTDPQGQHPWTYWDSTTTRAGASLSSSPSPSLSISSSASTSPSRSASSSPSTSSSPSPSTSRSTSPSTSPSVSSSVSPSPTPGATPGLSDPMGFNVLVVYQPATTSDPILCGGISGGQSIVLQLETGTNDYNMMFGTTTEAIMSYYKTKIFALNARMKKLFATYKAQGNPSILNISTSLNFDEHVTATNFQMGSGSAVYGSAIYGTSVYGGVNVIIAKNVISAQGKFLQYIIQNNLESETWTLFKLQQEYQPLKLR